MFVGYLTSSAGILTYKVYIPIWGLCLVLFMPFLIWYLIRLLLQKRKRAFKTGDTVSILGDSRYFIVFEYYTWKPLTLKLKLQDGDLIISVQHKYVSLLKEAPKRAWLPPDITCPVYRCIDPPKYTAEIKEL